MNNRLHLPTLAIMLCMQLTGFGAELEVAPPATNGASKVQYPDFASPGEKQEEIKAATVMTEDERELLGTLKDQPTSRLIELLNVYDRMENKAMVQAIAEVIEKRNPGEADLARVRKVAADHETIRKADYLDQQAASVSKGNRAKDPDAVDAQARYLLQQKRSAEAAELLEGLRKTNFPKAAFPYTDTLASCYFDLKRWDDAIAAWKVIQKDERYGVILRDRAESQIEMIGIEKEVEKAREQTYSNPDEAVMRSKAMLVRMPDQPAAIAFHVDALHYAGRDDEALAFIKREQAEWKGSTAFPYQRLLAHCELNLKSWDRAKDAFGSMLSDPIFDDAARGDAAKSIALTEVARNGEAAFFAAEQGDETEARRLIGLNKARFPNDLEALGYEATVLNRLGEQDKALELLLAKKHELAAKGPFQLQDNLGSIYIERKEYANARAAFTEILNDKRYDWDTRRNANKGLKDARKAELLDVAYRALRDRRPSRAALVANQLRDEFGASNAESSMLDAEVLLAQNKVVRARDALESIEKETPANKVFAGKTSLASAELRSGQWEKAMDRYRDILKRPLSVSSAELLQAKWEVREAIAIVRPSVEASGSYRKDDDGTSTKVQTSYQSPWMGTWRAGVFGRFEDIKLADHQRTSPSIRSTSFGEGGATVQRTFGDMLAAEMMAGISDGEPIYGARVGNFINPGLQWSAAFTGNERSTQSTLLEAAGAREHRVTGRISGPLAGPLNIDANLSAFLMNLEGQKLGTGVSSDAFIEYVLQTETPTRPEIGVGYVGHWQHFNSKSPLAAALFDGNVNQHGIQIELRKAITERLRANVMASTYYAFDEGNVGYAFGAGAHYYLSDNTALFLELRYNSESASASNAAGRSTGALEASLGASMAF
jgi:hypothetical protein